MQEISKYAIRYALVIYLFLSAFVWYVFYSLWYFLGKNVFPENVSSVLSIQNSNFHNGAYGVATFMTLAVLSVVLAFKGVRTFVLDVGDELSRVSWPTLKETQKSTAIVIVMVIVVGFFLFFADTLFQKIINLVMLTAA